jgi:phosphoglycolate phosphatase-like HAD superfamily hydrolase
VSTVVSPHPVILWDLDRTLVDIQIDLAAIQRWKAQLRVEFAHFGLSPALSPLLPGIEGALRDFAAVDASASDELGRRVYDLLDEWENAEATGFRVHEKAVAMFVALASAGVPQAVVTNNGAPVAQRALKMCLPSQVYENVVVVTRAFGRRAKPDGEPLLEAIRRLSLHPGQSDVIMVGDSSADELALQAVATQARSAIWVTAKAGQLWLGQQRLLDEAGLVAILQQAGA